MIRSINNNNEFLNSDAMVITINVFKFQSDLWLENSCEEFMIMFYRMPGKKLNCTQENESSEFAILKLKKENSIS